MNRSDQLSEVLDLTGQVECTPELLGSGGFGVVYKGRWVGRALNTNRPPIAVKVTILPPPQDERQNERQSKQIKRELALWSKINHKNILSLLGIAYIDPNTNVPALICPLMENGNAKRFRWSNPSFPHVRILYDIIQGLHYLHTFKPEIVHGDIKAVNVLINHQYEACLCDFGLSRFQKEDTLWITTAEVAGGTARWMSPELISGEASTPTKESDIYAYAMTCYEILSGNVPFKSAVNESAVLYKVMKGRRPGRIESCHTDDMWDIITRCWAANPEDRPCAAEVLEWVQPLRMGLDTRGVTITKGGETGDSSTLDTVTPSTYYTAKTSMVTAGSGKRMAVKEMGGLKKTTNWKSLSLGKVMEIEDKRTVAGNLMEPIIRKHLGVRKVLETENSWEEVGSPVIPASRRHLSIRKVLDDRRSLTESPRKPKDRKYLNARKVLDDRSEGTNLTESPRKQKNRIYLSARKVLEYERTKTEYLEQPTSWQCLNEDAYKKKNGEGESFGKSTIRKYLSVTKCLKNESGSESQETNLGSLGRQTGRMYPSICKVPDDGNESKSETTKVEDPGKSTDQKYLDVRKVSEDGEKTKSGPGTLGKPPSREFPSVRNFSEEKEGNKDEQMVVEPMEKLRLKPAMTRSRKDLGAINAPHDSEDESKSGNMNLPITPGNPSSSGKGNEGTVAGGLGRLGGRILDTISKLNTAGPSSTSRTRRR